MSAELLSIEELDRADLERDSKPFVQQDRDCRIILAASWPRSLELKWNAGGPRGRTTVTPLHPGKSIVKPLWQAQAWFGPFGLLIDFRTADEKTKQFLRDKYAAEKMRILNQYDYKRPISHLKGGLEPIGPHRFPDVTVAMRNDDGSEMPEIRLHSLYKIGEFDEVYPLDSFGLKESADDVKARYEAEASDAAKGYEDQLAALRREMAEMRGMMKGVAAGAKHG